MTVVLFDTEGAIDKDSAAALGLDCSKVRYVNPITLEETRNAVYKFLMAVREKKQFGKFIIAIDSVANLLSKMEGKRMDDDSSSADMGTFAKSVKSLLKVTNIMSTATKTPILLTNHVYDDPSALYPTIEKAISGGKSAKYLPSVIVQLGRKLTKDDGGKTVDSTLAASQVNYSGITLTAVTTKNRFIQQFLKTELYLSFSKGLNKYHGLLEIAKGMKVIYNKGSIYYDWEDNKLGYYKSFRDDQDLWDNRILPEVEKRIKSEWSYGNKKHLSEEVPYEDDGIEEEVTEVEPESTNPLDKLKLLKKKATETLDSLEQEDDHEDEDEI